MTNADAVEILQWYVEMGADVPVLDAPVNRYAEAGAQAKVGAPAARPAPASAPARPAPG